MAHTDRHQPAQYRSQSEREDSRNYWRPRADAAELRTLRRRDRAATRQTIRTAKDWDATVWPAYRRAAAWQLPSY